jgi:hypothetical protein
MKIFYALNATVPPREFFPDLHRSQRIVVELQLL